MPDNKLPNQDEFLKLYREVVAQQALVKKAKEEKERQKQVTGPPPQLAQDKLLEDWVKKEITLHEKEVEQIRKLEKDLYKSMMISSKMIYGQPNANGKIITPSSASVIDYKNTTPYVKKKYPAQNLYHPPIVKPLDILKSPLGAGFFYRYGANQTPDTLDLPFRATGFACVPSGTTVYPLVVIDKMSSDMIAFTQGVNTIARWYVSWKTILEAPKTLVHQLNTYSVMNTTLFDIFTPYDNIVTVLLDEKILRPDKVTSDIGFLVSIKNLQSYTG
jgi:hypothetical protein